MPMIMEKAQVTLPSDREVEGHPIVQGGPAAGVPGIHGTSAGAALVARPARMVDAGVRDGRAGRRSIPVALAE